MFSSRLDFETQIESDFVEPANSESDVNCLYHDQKEHLDTLIDEFKDIFSDKPGCSNLITHKINIKPDAVPKYSSPYRLNPQKAEWVCEEVNRLMEQNLVEVSNSSWASSICLVSKPDGSTRLLVDYKALNKHINPDPFSFPRIDDLLDQIGKAKYLTKLDASKGYWAIKLDEESIPLSAFVTPHGHFQWRYMSFGLRNAPATYNRMTCRLLLGCESFTKAYVDDIVIFSDLWLSHQNTFALSLRRFAIQDLS